MVDDLSDHTGHSDIDACEVIAISTVSNIFSVDTYSDNNNNLASIRILLGTTTISFKGIPTYILARPWLRTVNQLVSLLEPKLTTMEQRLVIKSNSSKSARSTPINRDLSERIK